LAPVQLFIILSALAIMPFAWLRGAAPERAVAALLLAAYLSLPLIQGWRWGPVLVGVALNDLAVWAGMLWLTLRYDRWWLLLAAGAQTLNLLSHPVLLLAETITLRDSIAAQWAFTLVSLYALLLGVLERRLSGEKPGGFGLRRTT
jgi:hypothetical protein